MGWLLRSRLLSRAGVLFIMGQVWVWCLLQSSLHVGVGVIP